MTTTELRDMQEAVRAAIATHSYFRYSVTAGDPPVTTDHVEAVIADNGMVDDAVEAALQSRGFAVVVQPPEFPQSGDQGRRRYCGIASIVVTVGVNPSVNSNVAQRNNIEAAVAVMESVARMTTPPGSQSWAFGDRTLTLAQADGLLVRIVEIMKQFTLTL